MSGQFTLMVAPNGARRGKGDHPAIPLTPDELAATAHACQAEGAGALHLHVRDAAGRHSLDAGLYREALAAIGAAAPGLDVQVTTEAAGRYDAAAQARAFELLRPAQASVALRELARDPEAAARLHACARETGTRIQHILHAPEDGALLEEGWRSGLIGEDSREALFVLGAYAPARPARPADILPYLARIEHLALDWMVCAFGPGEAACLIAAIALGGKARIGFENNIHTPNGQLADDNAAQTRHLVATAAALGFMPRKDAP